MRIGQTIGEELGAYEPDPSHCNEQRKKKLGKKRDPPNEINCCDGPDMIDIDDMQSEYDSNGSLELKSQK